MLALEPDTLHFVRPTGTVFRQVRVRLFDPSCRENSKTFIASFSKVVEQFVF